MAVWAPLDTIGNTIHRRVCPLYTFTDGGKVHVRGSAIPLRVGEDSLLLTAAHVCFDRYAEPVPLFTWGRNRPRAILGRRGAWEYRPAQTPDADIAVIELTDEDVDELHSAYQFTTLSEITTTKPKSPGIHYLIAGYPASRNRISASNLPSVATYIITGEIGGVDGLRESDKTDECHFSLTIPRTGIPKIGGGEFHLPKPAGMSGGGVWRLEIDTARRIATTPMLVGIGIEFHKATRMFVATRVQAAIPLVRDLVTQHLGPAT